MTLLAQHGDQLGLPPHHLLANDLRQHGSACRSAGVGSTVGFDIGAQHYSTQCIKLHICCIKMQLMSTMPLHLVDEYGPVPRQRDFDRLILVPLDSTAQKAADGSL